MKKIIKVPITWESAGYIPVDIPEDIPEDVANHYAQMMVELYLDGKTNLNWNPDDGRVIEDSIRTDFEGM